LKRDLRECAGVGVDEYHLGLSIIEDVGDLGRGETDIYRRQAGPRLGRAEPDLVEAVAILGENGDTVLRGDAQRNEALCDVRGGAVQLGIGAAARAERQGDLIAAHARLHAHDVGKTLNLVEVDHH
jgi:hypothetical protein